MGNSTAQVAIIQYADLQCQYCATFARDTWPQLRKEFVDTGKVLVAFRHFPMPMHPFAEAAAISAECAQEQGQFWQMHDLLFARSERLHAATGTDLAKSLHLDLSEFKRCTERPVESVLAGDREAAAAVKVTATPTFLVGRILPDRTVDVSRMIAGAQPLRDFTEALESVLHQHGPLNVVKDVAPARE